MVPKIKYSIYDLKSKYLVLLSIVTLVTRFSPSRSQIANAGAWPRGWECGKCEARKSRGANEWTQIIEWKMQGRTKDVESKGKWKVSGDLLQEHPYSHRSTRNFRQWSPRPLQDEVRLKWFLPWMGNRQTRKEKTQRHRRTTHRDAWKRSIPLLARNGL